MSLSLLTSYFLVMVIHEELFYPYHPSRRFLHDLSLAHSRLLPSLLPPLIRRPCSTQIPAANEVAFPLLPVSQEGPFQDPTQAYICVMKNCCSSDKKHLLTEGSTALREQANV